LSDYEGFGWLFEEIVRLAEQVFDASPAESQFSPRAVQQEGPRDELIERKDSVTYILNAPGYDEGQLLVSVLEDEVEVRSPGFVIKKPLPHKVDPTSASSKYRNGILSVEMMKKWE